MSPSSGPRMHCRSRSRCSPSLVSTAMRTITRVAVRVHPVDHPAFESDIEAIAGKGVRARVNGSTVVIGTESLLASHDIVGAHRGPQAIRHRLQQLVPGGVAEARSRMAEACKAGLKSACKP